MAQFLRYKMTRQRLPETGLIELKIIRHYLDIQMLEIVYLLTHLTPRGCCHLETRRIEVAWK